jgi:hypothetical protein
MRDVLRGSLARSLRGIGDDDRLAAAWTVICGRTLAGRGTVVGVENGTVHVEVVDRVWLRQLASMRASLAAQLGEASGVKVQKIEFAVRRRPAS